MDPTTVQSVRIEAFSSFLAACRHFQVQGSRLVCVAPADYNLTQLHPLNFYFTGEIFGNNIYIYISMVNLIKFLCPYADIKTKKARQS